MSRFTDLLSDFESEKRFLALLEPYDPAAGAVVPVYLSSHGFVSAAGDAPAHTYFDARLRSAFTFTRALFQQGKLSGRSVPGEGAIELVNEDGGLDHLATLAWGGRRIRVLMGGPDFALADYGLIFDGTAQGLAYGDGTITVNLRDLQYVFDREFQASTFAGTGGVEGGATLKDKRRPRAYGVCRAVSPIYLGPDSGRHLFAIGDGPIVGVYRVLDRGVPLAQVAIATNPGEWSIDLATGVLALGGAFNGPLQVDVIGARYRAEVSSSSLTIGTGSRSFAVASSVGFVVGQRVRAIAGSSPALNWMEGTVTSTVSGLAVSVDAIGGGGTFSSWLVCPLGTVAGIARAFATGMGVTSIDELSIAALDLHQPATVGIWSPEGGNGGELLDRLLDGAGCYWGFDRSGAFEVGRLDVPSASASLTLDETQILEIARQDTEEPSYEVTVGYARAWSTVSTDQLAGDTADADRAFLIEEWRREKASNPAVLAAWPLSKPIEVESVFDRQADAAAEAARLLAIFGVRRDYFKVTAKSQPLAQEIGDTLQIRHARYGLAAGKRQRVVDLTEDMDAVEVELGVWG